MKILLIGNGFDLAHRLPTKYTDFIYFLNKIHNIKNYNGTTTDFINKSLSAPDVIPNKMVNGYITDILNELNDEFDKNNNEIPAKFINVNILIKHSNNKILNDFHLLLDENFWFKYFIDKQKYVPDGWIDFELEISKVIQEVDAFRKNHAPILPSDNADIKKYILKPAGFTFADTSDSNYLNLNRLTETDFEKISGKFEEDLTKLIRCLEIYLCEFVAKTPIDFISPDINNIKFDKILSFNYTDTYKVIYDSNLEPIIYDYIHGKADIFNTIETNNMVLGIDEYLDDIAKNKEVLFLPFKKFYQRIHKETGCVFKDWINEIEDDYHMNQHELFIFGHSLDVSDKDILRELITNNHIKTTIFYHNKKAHASQIKNLVKVLGQDYLIGNVHGEDKSIIFKQQKEFINKSYNSIPEMI